MGPTRSSRKRSSGSSSPPPLVQNVRDCHCVLGHRVPLTRFVLDTYWKAHDDPCRQAAEFTPRPGTLPTELETYSYRADWTNSLLMGALPREAGGRELDQNSDATPSCLFRASGRH